MTRQKKRRDCSPLTSGSSDQSENGNRHQEKRVKTELSAADDEGKANDGGNEDLGSVRVNLFTIIYYLQAYILK